jgi:OOP family OmpA-OmpF porin
MDRKLKLTTACCAAILAAGIASTATADEDRIYASALLQYMFFDDTRPLENDFGTHLALGFPVTEKFVVEVNYLARNVDGSAGGALDQTGYGADAVFFFDRDGKMDPYFVLGVGQQTDDYGTATDDYTTIAVGMGLVDEIDENLAFRADIRAYDGEDFGQSTDIAFGIGLVYYFGEAQRQAAPVAAAAAAPIAVADKDTDGDGVMDSKDTCPGTAAGSKVDAAGCVLPVAAAAVAVVDTDGDGVADTADACPSTPKGVVVLADGCAPDMDSDGVKDPQDKCPGTPAGTKVLADGCPIPTVVKLEGVTFATGSDQLALSSKGTLDLAITKLKENPTVGVEVAGHTDASGNADKNRQLSQRRADAVRKYLLDGGVPESQVTARGYGPDEPIATNDTPEGRAANRRVELRVKQ